MVQTAFDPGDATALLLRLAGCDLPRPLDGAEPARLARSAFLAWLLGLPAGAERDAARAARPELGERARDPVLYELLRLIDGLLAGPLSPPGRRKSGQRSRRVERLH